MIPHCYVTCQTCGHARDLGPRFTVDGTLVHNGVVTTDYIGVGASRTTAPYAVHDGELQDWIAHGLRYRWQAELICWLAAHVLYRRAR